MNKSVAKDLHDLLENGIIDQATANRINEYYESKNSADGGRLIIAFGILGALLVGLGIILIVAHNWDSLPKPARLVFSFIPLLLSQILTSFLIIKKITSAAWRESAATLLILSIGTAISLVSQIYNIHGDLSKFIFLWCVLSVPVIYLLDSSMASLLLWIGSMAFACTTGYFFRGALPSWLYVLLAGAGIPFFIRLVRNKPTTNFTSFHHWIVPVTVLISFGGIAVKSFGISVLGFTGLAGVFLIVSQLKSFASIKWWINAWRISGVIVTVFTLLLNSFQHESHFFDIYGTLSWQIGGIIVVYLVGIFLLKREKNASIDFITFVFPIFIPLFIIGHWMPEFTRVLVNILILTISIVTIIVGAKRNHLGQLNLGLLIMSTLIVARFFDVEISFVARGLIFIVVGFGFFVMNYWMLRSNKSR